MNNGSVFKIMNQPPPPPQEIRKGEGGGGCPTFWIAHFQE